MMGHGRCARAARLPFMGRRGCSLTSEQQIPRPPLPYASQAAGGAAAENVFYPAKRSHGGGGSRGRASSAPAGPCDGLRPAASSEARGFEKPPFLILHS